MRRVRQERERSGEQAPDYLGLALMLGSLMFSLTKARGYVDPYDSLLGYFIFARFTL